MIETRTLEAPTDSFSRFMDSSYKQNTMPHRLILIRRNYRRKGLLNSFHVNGVEPGGVPSFNNAGGEWYCCELSGIVLDSSGFHVLPITSKSRIRISTCCCWASWPEDFGDHAVILWILGDVGLSMSISSVSKKRIWDAWYSCDIREQVDLFGFSIKHRWGVIFDLEVIRNQCNQVKYLVICTMAGHLRVTKPWNNVLVDDP